MEISCVTNEKENSQSFNAHAAANPKDCVKMGDKYGWKLKRVKPTQNPVLKVECIFEGEQTSFEDTIYD